MTTPEEFRALLDRPEGSRETKHPVGAQPSNRRSAEVLGKLGLVEWA